MKKQGGAYWIRDVDSVTFWLSSDTSVKGKIQRLTVSAFLEALGRNVLGGAYDLSVVEHAGSGEVFVQVAGQTHQPHSAKAEVREFDVALAGDQQTETNTTVNYLVWLVD